MPYPQKITAQAILAVALEHLERQSAATLSLRAIAADLQVAPNALYRYYADRSILLAAIAEEGTRALLHALQQASKDKEGVEAAQGMAVAYLTFAREHPELYNVIMSQPDQQENQQAAHEELWEYVVGVASEVVGRKKAFEAAVAFWGFLHGMIALEQLHMYGPRKPQDGIAFGLQALLRGMAASEDD